MIETAVAAVTDNSQHSVSVAWFPKVGFLHTHMDIVADGMVWNPYFGTFQGSRLESYIRNANITGRGFFNFKIQASDLEIKNLINMLEKSPEKLKGNCASSACAALKLGMGINVPFPINQSPVLTSAYLTVLYKLKVPQILKIEYFGKSAARDLLSLGVVSETSLSIVIGGLAGMLTVYGINSAGEWVRIFVPLEETSKSSSRR